jgi:hypothetical protein
MTTRRKGVLIKPYLSPPSPVETIGEDSIARAAMVLKKGLKTFFSFWEGDALARSPAWRLPHGSRPKPAATSLHSSFRRESKGDAVFLRWIAFRISRRRALALLSQYEAVILAGAGEPVAFFGYDGCQSKLLSNNQEAIRLAASQRNIAAALEQLAEAVGASQKINGTPENHPQTATAPSSYRTINGLERLPHSRRTPARRCHHCRRIHNRRNGLLSAHGKCSAPHPTDITGRRHRFRDALRCWCCDCLPRSTGDQFSGRRQRHVHRPIPVDARPGRM